MRRLLNDLRTRLPRVAVAVLASLAASATATATAESRPGSDRPSAGPAVADGQYIVVYGEGAGPVNRETGRLEQELGFESSGRYRHAVDGFSAELTDSQLRAVRRDPKVDFVAEDRRVSTTDSVPLAAGESTPPTGLRRVLAGTTATVREASDVNVAVIDTGIQLDHPDLNAADGKDCIDPGTPASDGNGHGTHVAGTIGAENDGAGVTGVAPGTKVYAVRVLDDQGSGYWSQVICGIDWVTANADALGIGVANMSLSGGGPRVSTCEETTDPLHIAICNSTGAGVNYAVAAGNDGWDFDYPAEPDVPAAYPQVLAVTALSDTDGLPGARGGSACGEADDAPATFSNYALTDAGKAHTIAAPGACIRSTLPGSGYGTFSGTSMASPHVAGLVALCLGEAGAAGGCAGKSTGEVVTRMRAEAEDYSTEYLDYGFIGDPLHDPGTEYFGFLSVMPGSGPPPQPEPVRAPEPQSEPQPEPEPEPEPDPEPIELTPVSPPADEEQLSPETTITVAPKKVKLRDDRKRAKVKIRFTSSLADSRFRCSLGKERYASCTSPFRAHLKPGKYRFRVKAKSGKRNIDPSPAKLVFKVKRKRR